MNPWFRGRWGQHNLTWYSAIVHKFTRIHVNLCKKLRNRSQKELPVVVYNLVHSYSVWKISRKVDFNVKWNLGKYWSIFTSLQNSLELVLRYQWMILMRKQPISTLFFLHAYVFLTKYSKPCHSLLMNLMIDCKFLSFAKKCITLFCEKFAIVYCKKTCNFFIFPTHFFIFMWPRKVTSESRYSSSPESTSIVETHNFVK